MEELLRAILSELTNGKRAMLATIVARRGSAPRGVGTAMVVSESGEQTGTVGGGSMEYRVRQDALKLLHKNACARKDYEIHADEKDAYSGGVSILFRLFAGEHGTALTQRMLDAILHGEQRISCLYPRARLRTGF
jgi:xanthine/CO dehydrogenase XdhC/CoxF family maturation factor